MISSTQLRSSVSLSPPGMVALSPSITPRTSRVSSFRLTAHLWRKGPSLASSTIPDLRMRLLNQKSGLTFRKQAESDRRCLSTLEAQRIDWRCPPACGGKSRRILGNLMGPSTATLCVTLGQTTWHFSQVEKEPAAGRMGVG